MTARRATACAKEIAAKFPAAKFYQYEALPGSAPLLGDGVKLVADFAKADRILSLDCDFAGTDPQGPVTPFFDRRKPEGKAYDAQAGRRENEPPLRGGSGLFADRRHGGPPPARRPPARCRSIAAAIARELGVHGHCRRAGTHRCQASSSGSRPWRRISRTNAGKSVVLAGSRQPAAVHHIALAINLALGNIGEGKPLLALQTETQGLGSLATLKADIDAGTIDTLFLLTPSNPVYDAPADLDFAASLAKVKTSIHLGDRTDATAHAATWHIPAAHYLESWSDTRSARGIYTVVQPMILPLYPDCVSELELLLALLSDDGKLLTGEGEKGAPSPAYAAVRKTFAALGGEGDAAWKKLLRDGFLAGSTYRDAPHLDRPTAITAGQIRRRARQGLAGSDLRHRRLGLRRPLDRQRLAPGSARSDLQTHLGQCRADRPEDRQGTRHLRSDHRTGAGHQGARRRKQVRQRRSRRRRREPQAADDRGDGQRPHARNSGAHFLRPGGKHAHHPARLRPGLRQGRRTPAQARQRNRTSASSA